MTELRRRMDEDMIVRGFADRTREAYLWAVTGLARFYRRPPDQVSDEEVQAYLLHLIRDRQRAWSTCNMVVHGLRFFFHTTLKRDRTTFSIPAQRQPSRLPALLSREDIQRLIAHVPNLKHRTMILTTYAAGLRLNEVLHLRVADIDSARTTIRVEQGKGGQDRYTVLSARLLAALRAYWIVARRRPWLFPSDRAPHRVALSNDRLVDHRDGRVQFRWKDYADHGRVKVMTLEADEFLRRFLLHVVPKGFMRIRHFGLLANRTRRGTVTRCRDLLGSPPTEAARAESVAVLLQRLTGVDLSRCPVCGEGRMQTTFVIVPWAPSPDT